MIGISLLVQSFEDPLIGFSVRVVVFFKSWLPMVFLAALGVTQLSLDPKVTLLCHPAFPFLFHTLHQLRITRILGQVHSDE